MSNEDKIEAAENSLNFIEETIKSVRKSVEDEGRSLDNKTKTADDTRITIEANARKLEALKRNLAEIQKSLLVDDATEKGTEHSIETSEEITKSERQFVTHGVKDCVSNMEGKSSDSSRNVDTITETLNEVLKLEAVSRDPDGESPIVRETRKNPVDNKAKPIVIKKRILGALTDQQEKQKLSEYGDKTAVPTEEDKFIATWNAALGTNDTDNRIAHHAEVLFERAREKCNLDNGQSQANEKSPPAEESFEEISNADINFCRNPDMEGMDNPFNAMLFSEQLIEYVLNKLGHFWPCVEGARNLPNESVSTRFSKIIGDAMLAIIDSNIWRIANCYKQLMKKNIHTVESFRIEVCVTATFYFVDGYSHYKFLIYAAQLAGLSAFYFAGGNTQISDASAQVLAYMLNYYIYQLCFSPSYDWYNLHLEAQKVRNEIQDGKIIFVMPCEAPVSTASSCLHETF